MKKVFLSILLILVLLTLFHVRAQSSAGISRIAGGDRYATAVEVSRDFYPDGAPTVYIANGDTLVDALAAGPSIDGPILLVSTNILPDSTRGELQRLNPSNVVILGGNSAVSSFVEEQIRNAVMGTTTSSADTEASSELYELINEERTEVLSRAADIDQVADDWSATMASDRTLRHNPNMEDEICCWTRLTENVGWTTISDSGIYSATQRVHETFMNSEEHSVNVVDPEVNEVGIGIEIGGCPDGTAEKECIWVTENFRG